MVSALATASARRSDSARLAMSEPTASVWPSIRKVSPGLRSSSRSMAEATPFREIVHRYPLDQLEEAFAEGLVTGHPAMPPFVFRASEIDDLIAYLETVKAEP